LRKIIATLALLALYFVPLFGQATGEITVRKVTVDATSAANYISVQQNDGTPLCSTLGTVGRLTLLDIGAGAARTWAFCDGTATMFTFPNLGTDTIANGEVLVGTGAGTAQFAVVASVAGTVTEADSSPSIGGADTLKFPNGTITDEGSLDVRIEPYGLTFPTVLMAGRWLASDNILIGGRGSTNINTLADDIMYYTPFYLPFAATFSNISFEADGTDGSTQDATGTGAGSARLCIYTMSQATGKPDARLFGSSAITVAAAGASDVQHTVSLGGLSLGAGFYYLGLIADGTTIPVQVARYSGEGGNGRPSVFGNDSSDADTGRATMMRETGLDDASECPANSAPANTAVIVSGSPAHANFITLQVQ